MSAINVLRVAAVSLACLVGTIALRPQSATSPASAGKIGVVNIQAQTTVTHSHWLDSLEGLSASLATDPFALLHFPHHSYLRSEGSLHALISPASISSISIPC